MVVSSSVPIPSAVGLIPLSPSGSAPRLCPPSIAPLLSVLCLHVPSLVLALPIYSSRITCLLIVPCGRSLLARSRVCWWPVLSGIAMLGASDIALALLAVVVVVPACAISRVV